MEDAHITLTLKGGANFNEPWLVLKADSWAELVTLLQGTPSDPDFHTDAWIKDLFNHILGQQLAGPNTVEKALAGGTQTHVGGAVEPPASRDPATPAQLNFIKRLGGTPSPNLSKAEASEYIQTLLAQEKRG